MKLTADEELHAVRMLLGDAAEEIFGLAAPTVKRHALLQLVWQAEKAAERAVKLARAEGER